jgi:hypothetical protein
MLSNWQNNFTFVIFRWPIVTRPDKIRGEKLQVVRTPQVIVIITVMTSADIGLPLRQRAIYTITATGMSVGRQILMAWSWIITQAFSLNQITKVPLIASFIMDLTIISSFYSSTGFNPYLPSSINYHFRQLLLFRTNNNYMGNTGGDFINSASATATTI